MMGNHHVRCEVGENSAIVSKSYLSLSKYFLVSLFLQQLYREILAVADEHGGKLENRVIFYCDELGTLPKIESLELIFSAGRSRGIMMVPAIQSFGQLQKNYGKEGAEIIVDNCQDIIFGGFAPSSQTAEELSKALGGRTVMSGSISRGKQDPSQSLQMMERPLMSPDELKSLPKGNFILMKTGTHPMRTVLPLFLDWGITFDKSYEIKDQSYRRVLYADKHELEEDISFLFSHAGQLYSTDKTSTKEGITLNSEIGRVGKSPEEVMYRGRVRTD